MCSSVCCLENAFRGTFDRRGTGSFSVARYSSFGHNSGALLATMALAGRVRVLILPLTIVEARDVLIRRLRLILGRYAIEESLSCSGWAVIPESPFASCATRPLLPVLRHGRRLHVLQINEDLLAQLIDSFKRRLIIWHRTCAHFGIPLATSSPSR